MCFVFLPLDKRAERTHGDEGERQSFLIVSRYSCQQEAKMAKCASVCFYPVEN